MGVVHLDGLNAAQLRAVQHSPSTPLQILAGPGSGKTKVLTSRIVHLIMHHGINPSNICAVTFTNKAALEMRTRLGRMLTKEQVRQIKMGTFHALCAQFLRKYATMVGINGNFTVCDADESKKIIAKMLKETDLKEFLKSASITLSDGTVASRISQAKAKGLSPEDLIDAWHSTPHSTSRKGKGKASHFSPLTYEQLNADLGTSNTKEIIDYIVANLYARYEGTLRDNNSLDFDDLLVYGVRLFGENPKVGKWCEHVLVDEFQDTNNIQYNLMRCLASSNRCVTIVGDPDQSIYGWRSAEVENLAKMRRDFASTHQIMLEDNYRSTGSILAVSMAIVGQDKARIQKTLNATHPFGPKPVLHCFPSDQIEASAIAYEVKRLAASMGDVLNYNDVGILLRYNALSRAFESAFRKEGIPTRILGGQRFFERVEVKDLLAYLQLLDNPSYLPAFTRVINVPARGLGQKSISELLMVAGRKGISPLEVARRIYEGRIPDIKPPVKRKIGDFIIAIKVLRKLALEGEGPANLIRRLLELVKYETYLQKTQEDWESRWENVKELINFASEMESDLGVQSFDIEDPESQSHEADEWHDVGEDEYDEEELDDLGFAEVKAKPAEKVTTNSVEPETPLRAFLQASMLSTDTGQTGDEKDKPKVTITTCHAAKGLEWPVVFVPVVEEGVFPSARAEDKEEERRLLYVACTRAQGLLYLTHSSSRKMAGETVSKKLSEFISVINGASESLFSDSPPQMTQNECGTLAKVLHRSAPDYSEARNRVVELEQTNKAFLWSVQQDAEHSFTPASSWNAAAPPGASYCPPKRQDVPSSNAQTATFVSARTTFAPPTIPSSKSQTERSRPARPLSPSKDVLNTETPILPSSVKTTVRPASENARPTPAVQAAGKTQTSIDAFIQRKSSFRSDSRRGDHTPVQETAKPLSTAPSSKLPPNSSNNKCGSTTLKPPTPFGLPSSESGCTVAPPTIIAYQSVKLAGGKRRLGMGHTTTGYPSKKFKAPGS